MVIGALFTQRRSLIHKELFLDIVFCFEFKIFLPRRLKKKKGKQQTTPHLQMSFEYLMQHLPFHMSNLQADITSVPMEKDAQLQLHSVIWKNAQ